MSTKYRPRDMDNHWPARFESTTDGQKDPFLPGVDGILYL